MTPDQLGDALVRAMPDALIACDAKGDIRFWNAAAERMFGYASSEAIGRSLDIIIPEAQRARHWSGYEKTMATGESRYGDGDLLRVPAVTKDGRRISIEFTIMALRDSAGAMEGVAAVIRDVTEAFEERRRLQRQLAAAQGRSSVQA